MQTRVHHSSLTIMNTVHQQHNNETNGYLIQNVNDFSGTDAHNFKRGCDNDCLEALRFLFKEEIRVDHYHYELVLHLE